LKPTIHHLSHIDLDGYSCQLIMEYTPYTIYSYNANYGAEVIERLNEILDVLKKSSEPSLIFITDLNLTLDEALRPPPVDLEADQEEETAQPQPE